ncbi:mucin-13b, partial [Cyclopterus lumpus]|uniref:mucin-13b n=1 Tax=Cyclopterus lumpus TaxID=8103 RepID=UPI0014861C41
CDGNPCKDGSACELRSNQTFVCLCLAGDDYDYLNRKCVIAKVFPGQLGLPDLPYETNMSFSDSPEFQEVSSKITILLNKVFNSSGGFSRVVRLSELVSYEGKFGLRSKKGVNATVDIIFKESADINTEEVEEMFKNATGCKCLLSNATFNSTDQCLNNPCDDKTSTCKAGNGSYSCTCLPNYIKTPFSTRMCIACASGSTTSDSITCERCDFGFSGVHCKESWKLAVVIVGSLLGIMLLITLILLPYACKSVKKSSKTQDTNADMGKPYVSHPPAQQSLVNSNFAKSQAASFNGPTNGLSAFANAGVPRIPRATTTNNWDSRTNLEMNLSNSRQNLIPAGRNSRFYDDHDDMKPNAQVRPQGGQYAQARPQNNPYAQNQPQNNPYAQNQPKINPYAQSQGNSNPYYMHDNGRRFN